MRIGIHLVHLRSGNMGGMEQYVRNLIEYAARNNSAHEFYLFLQPNNSDTFSEGSGNIRKVVIAPDRNLVVQLHQQIHDLSLDVWFCPLVVIEPFTVIPTVVTIPDLQHEFHSHFFSAEELENRNRHIRFSALRSDAILTLSEHAKQTMIEKYGLPEHKIVPVHLDSTKEFYSSTDEDLRRRVIRKYGLPDQYGLYPANTWPHKNHMNLLKALVVLRDRYNQTVPMVFTGSTQLSTEAAATYKALQQYIQSHGLDRQVQFIGYVPQEEMPYIYRKASFLAFPSLFEGFGIPLVEAMRTHIPIVCSNAASIPEVVGDSALLFDPHQPEDIAVKIMDLQDHKIRKRLIQRGKKRAAAFSWDIASKQTLNLFENLAAGGISMRIARKLQMIFQLEGHEFVTEVYREFLNREPDPGGLQDHVNLLGSGVPKINIVLGIMQSQEAQNLYYRGH